MPGRRAPLGTPTRRLQRGFAMLAGGLLLALAAIRALDLWWWQRQILATAESRAVSLTNIASEYLQEAFNAGDASLRQLAIHSQRVGGPLARDAEWAPVLNASKAGLGGLGSISVVDASGTITHSTIGSLVGESRKDEYLFTRLAAQRNDELIVDRPFLTRFERPHYLIPIGRRLTSAGNAFDGMVVSTFSPASLQRFFNAVDVGREGLVWVFHPSGVVMVREPSAGDPIGESAGGNPIFDAAIHGATIKRVQLASGGPTLISASRTLSVPPLIVAVSLSEHELLAEWRRERLVAFGVILVLSLGFAGTLVVLGRQVAARTVAEEALGQVQHLEAIGRLTGGIAHDFNNMLTAILGYTNLMLSDIDDQHPLREDLEEVHKAGESAAKLIRQLLAFSRRQVLQPQIIDLNSAVTHIESMLQRVIGEHITFVVRLAPTVDPINADPTQVEQIVMNLALNARDAMPAGGTLTIETGAADLDAAYAAQHPGTQAGRHVMLAVSDTGVGMDASTMAHMFEPFFTTKKRGEGTGLGLATVYGIVKQSGGSIWIYSEPGKGSTFKVYFPVAHASAIEPTAAAEPMSTRGTETILLTEDQDEVRAVARTILTRSGYTVLEAANPYDALRIARNHRLPIDLLFTDIVMPGMNGRELAQQVQAIRRGIKVLYSSGYTDDTIVRTGVLERDIAFIQKPYAPDALLHKVRDVLDA
jgi:signal transduction histidine kinase